MDAADPTPRDVVAERTVLAGVYRHGLDGLLEVDGLLNDGSFTDEAHHMMWRVLRHVATHTPRPDPASVQAAATALGVADRLLTGANRDVVRGILNLPVERENLRGFAQQARKLQVARELRDRLLESAASLTRVTGLESLGEITGGVEQSVFGFTSALAGDTDDMQLLGEFAPDRVQFLADHPVQQAGIATGFGLFDEAIGGGLRPGGVDVIGAFTGEGKTSLGLTFAKNIARQGIPVGIVDTEMSHESLSDRAVAAVGEIWHKEIETGRYRQPDNLRRAVAAANDLKRLPIWYKSVVNRPFDEITAVLRRWVVKQVGVDVTTGKAKPCVVILDYLKFTDERQLGNMAEYQAMGFLMTRLHGFAARYGVSVVAFVQLNREGGVSMSHRIMWLATSYSTFIRKDEEDLSAEYAKPKDRPRYTHKLTPGIKVRFGPGLAPGQWIEVQTDYRCGLIREGPLSTHSRPDQGVSNASDAPGF